MSHKVTRGEVQFCQSQAASEGARLCPLPEQRDAAPTEGCCSGAALPGLPVSFTVDFSLAILTEKKKSPFSLWSPLLE